MLRTTGLSHSPSTDSVMFPYYQGFANEVAGNVELGYDDIMAMYNLYSKVENCMEHSSSF